MKRLAIAAAAALLVSAPAFAASNTFQMEVEFAPAKLSSPQGAQQEYDRIAEQVSSRCATEHRNAGTGRVFQNYAAEICTRQTLDRAIREANHPALTEVHAARRAGS
ncbi:UrcA family protein [Hyphomonas sp.]|uniref:UrcA family protein n=1 Tax=Hyphomonas sp. TaxID=87 RepID=UPI00391BCFE6